MNFRTPLDESASSLRWGFKVAAAVIAVCAAVLLAQVAFPHVDHAIPGASAIPAASSSALATAPSRTIDARLGVF